MDEAVAVSVPSLHVAATLSGRAMAFWDSWQGKGRERFFYHTELLADVAVHLLTLLHHMHVWLLHGMSFHLLDALLLLDTRLVVMSLVTRVKAHMMHR
jgi:autocrine motility factor receptor